MQASPRQQPFAVVINTKPQAPNHASEQSIRPLTVDEALKFTPLTTSVSASHDRIPFPEIGSNGRTLRLTTSTERKAVQRSFAQQSVRDVKSRLGVLLDSSTLAEIKFKQLPFSNIDEGGSRITYRSQLNLTPAARMVLDSTNIDYQYPSPSSPPVHPREASQAARQPSLPGKTIPTAPGKHPRPGIGSDAPQAMHAKSLPYTNGNSTPISSIKTSQIVVEVPSLPTSGRRDDYIVVGGSPKRRKLTDEFRETKPSIHVRAQKDVADTTLLQFQDLLLEIFEAQDQLEPDTSLTSIPEGNAFFDVFDEDGDRRPRLLTEVHNKLHSLMKQLVDYERFTDLSSEHLLRLQNICEDSIEVAQTISLKVEIDISEDDIERWRVRAETAANSYAAAATTAWIMIGNPDNAKFVSPDVVRWLPNVLVNAFENCLIPVIESRPDTRDAEVYKSANFLKEGLRPVLSAARRLLDLVANVCVTVKGIEEAVNGTEFLAAKLIFVENAKNEKESVLGVQTFEKVRKTAMSVLAKLFAKFPKERAAILDEILSSIDKLPSTSRSARQYTVPGGKIQLISALIMQLVQTTASETPEDSAQRDLTLRNEQMLRRELSDDENDDVPMKNAMLAESKPNEYQTDAQRLLQRVKLSYDNGVRSAGQIVGYLIHKASTSTKTGDQPYRNLLDLFIEDLLEVMHLTEWPASELLLRIIANQMIDIVRNDQTALAKNMALEALGNMGSAISTLRASIPITAAAVAREASTPITQHLLKLADDQSQGGIRNEDLVATNGPLRLVYQALFESSSGVLQNKSACGFSLAQWAKTACMALRLTGAEDADTIDSETSALLEMLLGEMEQAGSQLDDLKKASMAESKLAHALANLNQGLGRRFADIVKTLSGSLTSGQSQVRSRSLKSVDSILETDSSLLDRDPTLMDDIFRCVSDDSAMVRDSALALIAKIIVWKPALQEKGIRHILESSADAKVGVQKKSLGHLKDIYLRDASPSLSAAIAENVLKRTADIEDTVSELAKKTLTEIWVTSKLTLLGKDANAKEKVAINDLALILVRTIARNPVELTPLAEDFFKLALRDNKAPQQVVDLYTAVVQSLFESIVSDSGPLSENTNKEALLLTLNIFANANARTIAPDQLSALRPYLGNLVSEQDLQQFKPVVAIFRSVLPHLSATHKILLQEIHQDLMKTITKLRRRNELDEVLESVWVIHPIVESTAKLINTTVSVLKGIVGTKAPSLSDVVSANEDQTKQLLQLLDRKRSYVRIAGSIGKHFDLEYRIDAFKTALPNWSSKTLAGYMVNIIAPLSREANHPLLRNTALESLGAICLSWPNEFKQEIVQQAFIKVFKNISTPKTEGAGFGDLQNTALKAFLDMLELREAAKKASDDAAEGKEQQDLKRLGGSVKAGDQDGAVAIIAQEYLPLILKTALGRQDEKSLLAVKVITSVDRQGLVHPKQCMGTIVALEGSTNAAVAELAGQHQQYMHQQHESMYEREYIKAVQDAFEFQRDIIGDSAGTTRAPFRAKLSRCFQIIKSGSTKFVKKFLSQMITRANVEMPKLETDRALPENMLLTRFIAHNLAFFEYEKLDELLHTIHHIESVFGKTGAEIAQAIDAALQIDPAPSPIEVLNEYENGETPIRGDHYAVLSPQPQAVDPAVLKRMATAATMMTVLWDTRSYLKRQYGIDRDVRQVMAQVKQSKEGGKPPSRVQSVTGDRYYNGTTVLVRSLESQATMVARCQEFSSLMTIDDDVRQAAQDDDDARARFSASVDPDEQAVKTGRAAGRKRKGSTSTSGTPKKKKGRPVPKSQKSRRGSASSRSSRDDPNADFEGF